MGVRISRKHFVFFKKKETKTGGCTVREQAQVATKGAPTLNPGGTIFGRLLTPPIPTYNEVSKTPESGTT
ncbi:MAG: hypothetical protein CSA33_03955 [Desulfobulbus propionicus]|nr:MAG: hypothetical protein CSA33_03955 [Desulfobulbus propionicus]